MPMTRTWLPGADRPGDHAIVPLPDAVDGARTISSHPLGALDTRIPALTRKFRCLDAPARTLPRADSSDQPLPHPASRCAGRTYLPQWTQWRSRPRRSFALDAKNTATATAGYSPRAEPLHRVASRATHRTVLHRLDKLFASDAMPPGNVAPDATFGTIPPGSEGSPPDATLPRGPPEGLRIAILVRTPQTHGIRSGPSRGRAV